MAVYVNFAAIIEMHLVCVESGACIRDASEELWIVRHSRVSNQQWICSVVGATLEQLKLDEHADENQSHDSMHGRRSPTNLAKLARINKTLHGRQENIA